MVKCFVQVSCLKPIGLDGELSGCRVGWALVVDAVKGLVLVSRLTIPFNLCDIAIAIAESIRVEGRVVFSHPFQNHAIIKYDPSYVRAPVEAAKFSNKPIRQGQEDIFFGFNGHQRPLTAKTSITDISACKIPPDVKAPHYRAININAISVDTRVSNWCSTGVFMSDDGTIEALWLPFSGPFDKSKRSSYNFGLATYFIRGVVKKVSTGQILNPRMLNMEAKPILKDKASVLGVSEEWIQKMTENPHRHEFFIISKVFSLPPSVQCKLVLEEGDVILTLNDRPIFCLSEFGTLYSDEYVDALVVRQGQEMSLKVLTVPFNDLEIDQVVVFCGAVLQKPHLAVRQQLSKLHSEVYVSTYVSIISLFALKPRQADIEIV